MVPGARWVNYTRPGEAAAARSSARLAGSAGPRATVARFLLDGPVLPLVTGTVRVAEAVRHELLWRFQRHGHRAKYGHADRPYLELFRSPVFSGKEADGQVLRHHQHAFYLPTAEGADPMRITHVTVMAADGFGPGELAALNGLRQLRLGDDSAELRVQLVGLGDAGDFRTPLLAESRTWVSATPFVVTRFPKLRGRKRDRPEDYATPADFARRVLIQESERFGERGPDLIAAGGLADRAIPELERVGVRGQALPAIERIDTLPAIGPRALRSLQFQCFRRKPGDDGGRRPHGAFRIVFAGPVRGPLCVGHSCHFGLGLFLPAEEEEESRH